MFRRRNNGRIFHPHAELRSPSIKEGPVLKEPPRYCAVFHLSHKLVTIRNTRKLQVRRIHLRPQGEVLVRKQKRRAFMARGPPARTHSSYFSVWGLRRNEEARETNQPPGWVRSLTRDMTRAGEPETGDRKPRSSTGQRALHKRPTTAVQ